MNGPRVVITGIGMVSPFGVGSKLNWQKLLNGYCAITKLNDDAFHQLPCTVAGSLTNEDLEQVDILISKSDNHHLSRAQKYALVSADEALRDANWFPLNEEDKNMTGVAIGTGMVDLNEVVDTSMKAAKDGIRKISPYFIPKILPNLAAGYISIKNGFRGPNHCVSTACTTGLHSIGDGFNFIRNGQANVMVCGATESPISFLAMAGFCRLRALATKFNNDPQCSSRPFDDLRNGFVMGEGSAVVILENRDHAINRNVDNIYAEILGYGLSGDASHITNPDKSGIGATLCMNRALLNANLSPDDLSFINAHATSTPIGDNIELASINQIFGNNNSDNKIYVSSTKGNIGHLLGAAGAIELAFAAMSCKSRILPFNLNFNNNSKIDLMKNIELIKDQVKDLSNNKHKIIGLKNSFGFGGTNAAIVISSFDE